MITSVSEMQVRGHGIAHRLLDAGPGMGGKRFQLGLWKHATTLGHFGVELCVARGSVVVELIHCQPDGSRAALCTLTANAGGSNFSPPFDLHTMAGDIAVELREVSENAVYDLYFGTNQVAPHPATRLAFVLGGSPEALGRAEAAFVRAFPDRSESHVNLLLLPDAKAESEAVDGVAWLPHMTPEPGAIGRGLWHLLYGPGAHLLPSHLCLVDDIDNPTPALFSQTLAMARFLKPECGLAAPQVGSAPGLEWVVVPTLQILETGLPYPFLGANAGADYRERLAWNTPDLVEIPDARQASTPVESRGAGRSWVSRQARKMIRKSTRKSSDEASGFWNTAGCWSRLIRGKPLPTDETADSLLNSHRIEEAQARRALAVTEVLGQRLSRNEERWRRDQYDKGLHTPEQVKADLERANHLALTLLRDRHAGARAVIVGNGPSLRISDLNKLHDCVSFGSNKIYLAFDQTNWRPTYYSVEDHLVMLNNRAEIEAQSGSVKLFLSNLRAHGYHAADTIFAPVIPPHSYDDPLADPDFPAFSTDLTRGIGWGSSVVYSQIQMALYVGCREIVLIGVDHRYELPPTKVGHSYRAAGERNHFHPEYRAPGELWHRPNLDVLEHSFARAREGCEAVGARIFNASRDTALTVFERADFDQLFPVEDAGHA